MIKIWKRRIFSKQKQKNKNWSLSILYSIILHLSLVCESVIIINWFFLLSSTIHSFWFHCSDHTFFLLLLSYMKRFDWLTNQIDTFFSVLTKLICYIFFGDTIFYMIVQNKKQKKKKRIRISKKKIIIIIRKWLQSKSNRIWGPYCFFYYYSGYWMSESIGCVYDWWLSMDTIIKLTQIFADDDDDKFINA